MTGYIEEGKSMGKAVIFDLDEIQEIIENE